MTLNEALSELLSQLEECGTITETDLVRIASGEHDDDAYLRTAIATILNAVVKGELRHE